MKKNRVLGMLLFVVLISQTLQSGEFEKKGSIVYDKTTQLSWVSRPITKKMIWENAVKYCNNSELSLPTLSELKSLVDYSKTNPAIRTALIKVQIDGWYWTSSVYRRKNKSNQAWVVNFGDGNGSWYSKTYKDYVLCVSRQ